MVLHQSTGEALPAGPGSLRKGISDDLFFAHGPLENVGPVKRFERFISPYLVTDPQPSEDFLSGLIQRNSWLR